MIKTKRMNEFAFAKIIKEINAAGEFIRAKQDEKQSVIIDFEKEKNRYRAGKISETALASSVRKTNKELKRLDQAIRDAIAKARDLSDRAKDSARAQAPRVVRAKIAGIRKPAKKKKKRRPKKKPEKKSAKKAPKKAKLKEVVKKVKKVIKKAEKKVANKAPKKAKPAKKAQKKAEKKKK